MQNKFMAKGFEALHAENADLWNLIEKVNGTPEEDHLL